LTDYEIKEAVRCVIILEIPDSIIAAFLTALTMAGTTERELRIIREILINESKSFTIPTNASIIDNCGTGGDMMKSFNISTAAALIAASLGCTVAKHGNKSASGICGSADFLEQVGFDLDCPTEKVVNSVEKIGICFLYAPKFHPSLGRISPIRKQIGFRTIFNILGPLSNPCSNLSGQVIGISDSALIEPLSSVMKGSDIRNVILVHSDDGHDELSNTSENTIVMIKNSEAKLFRFNPNSVGIKIAHTEEIQISSVEDSVRSTLQVIHGNASSPKQDMVILNSSLALLASEKVDSIRDGIEMSRRSLKSAGPRMKLWEMINACGDVDKLARVEKKIGLDH
jgi:anthranilate phosphoribosyltransferase